MADGNQNSGIAFTDFEDESSKEEREEVRERDTYEFWDRWLKAAEKADKRHREDTKAAWKEYENVGNENAGEALSGIDPNPERVFPIYWASCKVLESALYGRTPKIRAKREFDINDPVALTACEIHERVGRKLIKDSEYDAVMVAAVLDFLHGDKATTQIILKQEKEITDRTIALQPTNDPNFFLVPASGMSYRA